MNKKVKVQQKTVLKKLVSVLSLLIALSMVMLGFSGCNNDKKDNPNGGSTTNSGGTTSGSETPATTANQQEEDNNVDDSNLIVTKKFDLYTATKRFWKGSTVYNESVYPMTTATGENEVIQLLYDATEIIEVRTSDLRTVFEADKDYKLENGKIIIPEGSAIKVNKYDEYYLTEKVEGNTQDKEGGGYLYFAEGSAFHDRQISVSYKHTSSWDGPRQEKLGAKLPKLQERLEKKEAFKIVYSGDSITQGANASGPIGKAPSAPAWPAMFTKALREFGSRVTETNTAVGGQVSSWGYKEVQANIIDHNPDLVVLAFGMNDGSHNVTPTAFKANIAGTVKKIRESLPDCEVILIATMLPNPEAVFFVANGFHEQYQSVLNEISNEYEGVAVANVTQAHKYLLTRKNYRDMTGNNINHPNDFLTRVYTQVLLDTVSK